MFIYDDPSVNVVKPDGTVFRPTLDIFPNRTKGRKAGAVIILPGGGYSHLAPHEGGYLAGCLAAFGLHTAVLNYRVSPCTFPAPQQDALRAIRILRAKSDECNIDPDKIALLGFSAGGHLCASCGTKYADIPVEKVDAIDEYPSNPNAMILCYPVIDIYSNFGHIRSGDCLFGSEEMTPLRQEWCLQNAVTENTPPAFLWHTATDKTVPVENSIAFAKAMWQKGRTCELHIYPEGPHGIGAGHNYPNADTWLELAAKFLINNCGFPTCEK